jgi:hypothetical protein
MIPVSTVFFAFPFKAELMPRKRCAGIDENEPTLSIGDVGHHAVDPDACARNKRLLRQSNTRIVEYLLAVVLMRAVASDMCALLFKWP